MSTIVDEIVSILDTITAVTGNVKAAVVPEMDIDDVHHPPGILVTFADKDLSTEEDQPAMSVSRKMEPVFEVLVVARSMRTDTTLGPGLTGIIAEVEDKLHGVESAISGVHRPYMLQSVNHQRTDKGNNKVGYIMDFKTLVIVKTQP